MPEVLLRLPSLMLSVVEVMIKIVCVGKMKDKALQALQDGYVKKSQPYHKMSVIEVAEAKNKSMEIARIKQEEAQNILQVIQPGDQVIALTLQQSQLDSEGFSQQLYEYLDIGKTVVYVIGGSWGLDESVIERADQLLSISAWTLPHLLCRVVLLEQIYRAHSINRNTAYHK